MIKKVYFILVGLLFSFMLTSAQEVQKSELHQRAEAADEGKNIANARFLYIRAYEDYMNKGQAKLGVECGVKGTALYYKENYYKEAFDLLHRIEDNISVSKNTSDSEKAALRYLTSKERMQMYLRMKRSANVQEQLNAMEAQANASGDESVRNDFLYNKAIYHYTFGQVAQGNAVFKEMADKLTASKEYDKIDQVYQTLIANGRKSGSANIVAQSYNNYMLWKDSVTALKYADQIEGLKKQIADNEATIADKDSSLTTRQVFIVGLCILAAVLAAALVLGGIVLMRFIFLTRKQKNTIKLANETNALKAKFISNISAQLNPTLHKLDGSIPEVKALLDFSSHVETLSKLENSEDVSEFEEIPIPVFCEEMMNQIRDKVKSDVTLTVNAPKMGLSINKEYVSHILTHLLNNAAEYTPEGGKILLDYKKRGAHSHQFIVTDTGEGIPEEKREEIFKPFREIRDLTTGDGLGLPICKQMALKMKGDLDIDPEFTRGARFILSLHS